MFFSTIVSLVLAVTAFASPLLVPVERQAPVAPEGFNMYVIHFWVYFDLTCLQHEHVSHQMGGQLDSVSRARLLTFVQWCQWQWMPRRNGLLRPERRQNRRYGDLLQLLR